jgi:ankyrin repeat protein
MNATIITQPQLRADAKSFIPTTTTKATPTTLPINVDDDKQEKVINKIDQSNDRRSKSSKTKSQKQQQQHCNTNKNRSNHHGRSKKCVPMNGSCEDTGIVVMKHDKSNDLIEQSMHKLDILSPSPTNQKLCVSYGPNEGNQSRMLPRNRKQQRQQHLPKYASSSQQHQRRRQCQRDIHHKKYNRNINDSNPVTISTTAATASTGVSNLNSTDLSIIDEINNDDITHQMTLTTSFPTLQSIKKSDPNRLNEVTTLSSLTMSENNNVWSMNQNTNHLLQTILQQQQQELEQKHVVENSTRFNNDIVQFVPLVSSRFKNKNENCNLSYDLDATTNQESTSIANKPTIDTTQEDSNILSLQQIRSKYKSSICIDKLRDRWWNLLKLHKQQQHEQQQNHDREGIIIKESINTTTEVDNHSSQSITPHTTLSNQQLHTCTESKGIKQLTYNDNSNNHQFIADHTIPDSTIYQNLGDAIYQNDIDQLKSLLQRLIEKIDIDTNYSNDQNIMQLLHLAVTLDRPNLVRILCIHLERSKKSVVHCPTNRNKHPVFDTNLIPISIPLLIAVEHGYDECLNVLLLYFGVTSLLTTKDKVGNTAFHCCCDYYDCINGTNRTTFSFLLDYIASSSGYTLSFLFKVLSCQNHQQQTPLHVAAQYGRVDIVDTVLNHRLTSNISFLTKLLSIQDIEGQTPLLAAVAAGSIDVVMSLQMWRGNNYTPKRPTPPATLPVQGFKNAKSNDTSSNIPCPCPLAWAVKFNNVDMVSLLLEFNNPLSESGYKLNDALCTAINIESFDCEDCELTNIDDYNENDTTTREIIRVLVEAGANPCAIDDDDIQSNSKHGKSQRSCAIVLAAMQCELACLQQLLDSYDEYLYQIRYRRRHDPKLQSQPESFFVGIESTENAERNTALKEALLLSLSMIQLTSKSKSSQGHVKCSIMLYERDVQLGNADIVRLVDSFIHHLPLTQLINGNSFTTTTSPAYESSNLYLIHPNIQNRHDKNDRRSNECWSRVMAKLSLFENVNVKKCAFLSSSQEGVANISLDDEGLDRPDVVITCIDGQCLYAHRAVLARSAKLDAAIRFATMCNESTNDLLQVNVDLSYKTCRQLLIHLYHGSLLYFDENPSIMNPYECCMELLELMVMADEYLCQSFIVECIIRLLASNNDYDRCYCSYCRGNDTYEPNKNNNHEVIGPSHLITTDTVLDVLAIAQQIRWNTDGAHENDDVRYCKNESSFYNSLLNKLLQVTLYVALCDFGAVLQSNAFIIAAQCNNHHQTNDDDVSCHIDPNAKGMLLQMILNEIYMLKCS